MTARDSLPGVVGRLWTQMSRRRRVQLFAVLGMMLAGAFGEVLTLGAVLPFLAFVADPGGIRAIRWSRGRLPFSGFTVRARSGLAYPVLRGRGDIRRRGSGSLDLGQQPVRVRAEP